MNMLNDDFTSGLLESFKDNNDVTPSQAKVVLSHQQLYNETLSDVDTDINSHKFLSAFRRLSFPIVVRALRAMKTPQLVTFNPVQDFIQPVGRHHMKTIMPYPNSDINDGDITILVAQQIALEIDQHVVTELRDRAGIVAYIDPNTSPSSDTDFVLRLWALFREVENRSGFIPNWVVASSEVAENLTAIADEFEPSDDSEHPLGIRCLGTIGWRDYDEQFAYQKLYENTLATEHELLLGYKGRGAKTFQFRPKILLEATPSRRKNQKVTRARLQTQFETIWPDNGGDFYARINVKAPD